MKPIYLVEDKGGLAVRKTTLMNYLIKKLPIGIRETSKVKKRMVDKMCRKRARGGIRLVHKLLEGHKDDKC